MWSAESARIKQGRIDDEVTLCRWQTADALPQSSTAWLRGDAWSMREKIRIAGLVDLDPEDGWVIGSVGTTS